jgi:hypothetical protein
MSKRYQVFVSSTYADLTEERRKVLQALMEMDCIPAGMEIFPAIDEEQFEFIKRIIDDCDYYILLIGGRYGSTTDEGISFTEKEYDYAMECGLKIIALIHGSSNDISFGKSEQDPSRREKLNNFKDKVMTNRLVKFWRTGDELPGLVMSSLLTTIKTYPAIGWVRATGIPNTEVLSEMNSLRKRVSELERELASARAQIPAGPNVDDLVPLDEKVTIKGRYIERGDVRHPRVATSWSTRLTWRELFSTVAPQLLLPAYDSALRHNIADLLLSRIGRDENQAIVNDLDFDGLKVQLMAYGLVDVRPHKTNNGEMALFWQLTSYGQQLMLHTRSVRKGKVVENNQSDV